MYHVLFNRQTRVHEHKIVYQCKGKNAIINMILLEVEVDLTMALLDIVRNHFFLEFHIIIFLFVITSIYNFHFQYDI